MRSAGRRPPCIENSGEAQLPKFADFLDLSDLFSYGVQATRRVGRRVGRKEVVVGRREMVAVVEVEGRREGRAGASHMAPGGPIGPRSVLFFRKYFSSLARMCLP